MATSPRRMTQTKVMRQFARWHIWLGWLAGVPLLLWTVSGLWMVARPIEEVRGIALRADPANLSANIVPAAPRLDGRQIERLELVQRADQPVWIIRFAGGDRRAADALTGAMLPGVNAGLARRIADAALLEPAAVIRVSAFAAVDAPLELRQDRSSWQVIYADDIHVYVDALTGEVLAVRSNQWRWFDFMWGLHILDPQTREDTHHPLLIGFAVLAMSSCLLGFVLLFRRRKSPPASGQKAGGGSI